MTGKRLAHLGVIVGAVLSLTFSPSARAQSVDALLDKLVDKGILSVKEANDLKQQSDKNFNAALQARNGMPDWVKSLKFGGDFRGRVENFSSPNPLFFDRTRFRYRLRFGVTATIQDDFEVGFRLGSGEPVSSSVSTGNPLSNNTTFQDNATKKMIYIDTAYGKWSPLHDGGWTASTTIGKMVNPFQSSPMVFDPDYTPEGMAMQAAYKIGNSHSLRVNGGAFVLDELKTSGRDPFFYGAQLIWDAKWSRKLESSLSFSVLNLVNKESLANPPNAAIGLVGFPSGPNAGGVPDINAGNTRAGSLSSLSSLTNNGALVNNYNPLVGGANLTYTLDSFPLFNGPFPIKLAGEYMFNPGAGSNNVGFWVGITFGKSGKRGTWDLSYRYQRLEADAWYEELVNDDNGAYYAVASANSPGAGYFGGTNIKGQLVTFNYSLTDSLTISFNGYFNNLILDPNRNYLLLNPLPPGSPGKPPTNTQSSRAVHFYVDLMWKF